VGDRWSDKLSDEQIRQNGDIQSLGAIIVDQQFDYWYDPCGRSGHDLNDHLTPRARIAMKRLKDVLWNNGGIKT
jgi:hypothetical protein